MARIPEAEVERLKRSVSLPRLIEGQGHALGKQGKDLACRCPWHAGDETPSCIVSPQTNLWHCFGCDAGGSVIDWIMRSHKVSFRQACELLLKDSPVLTASTAALGMTASKQAWRKARPAADLSASEDDQAQLDAVIGYYHDTLRTSPEALAYLTQRGLDDAELIERFRLGFANRTLGYRLPRGETRAGAAARGQLQRLGLLRDSGHEHFNGSLVIPVIDGDGRVVEVYGRKVRDDLRAGTPKHLYLPGPHRGVWNADGLAGCEEVILCEALIDALTFWRAGYRNVTASYGVHGFTDEHLSTFAQCGIRRVLIAYDRDAPGDTAATELAPKLQATGFAVFRLLFPKGMDANSYALSVQPASKSLGVVIRSAQWLGDGVAPDVSTAESNNVYNAASSLLAADEDESDGDCGDTAGDRRSGIALTGGAVACAAGGDAAAGSMGVRRSERGHPRVRAAVPAADEIPLSALVDRAVPGVRTNRDDHRAVGDGSTLALDAEGDGGRVDRASRVDPLGDAAATRAPESAALILPAAAVPPSPALDDPADVKEHQLVMTFGERRYRVRGHTKNSSYEVMKVNVMAAQGEALHVDTVDLYTAKQRQAFARAAAAELSVEETIIQRDLGKLLLKLEQLQDTRIADAMKPKLPIAVAMSEAEHVAALAFLMAPDLIARVRMDVERIGIVGESANALVGYLACVSRKLSAPLAIIIQSTSAAGKSMLMDAMLSLVPEEDRVHYSAMTGQSLFYLGETSVKHKVLAIAEEEGVRQAAYALKVLQSQGVLTIASTGKDPATGMLVTQEYRVEGPVMLFLTTTAIDIDEELLNRCLVLTINESREQTQLIQQRQRAKRTLDGLIAQSQTDDVLGVHRNAQRLLRPLAVVNPFAEQLTFLDDRTRTRRDHQKYLALIDSITLLHQYQRPVRLLNRGAKAIEYIEVELSDIALANDLAHEVLGRSLDELPPQTRRVLGVLDDWVRDDAARQATARSEVRFTRRDVRRLAGLSDTQARLHLDRLVQLDYVLPHAGRNGQRFIYELSFDGDAASDAVQMIGLMDVAALAAQAALPLATTATSRGETPDLAGRLRAACGELAPTSRSEPTPLHVNPDAACSPSVAATAQTALFPAIAPGVALPPASLPSPEQKPHAHARRRSSSSLAAAL